MSRRYSPQEKQLALQRLIANGYDTGLTSLQTGVPERTLWFWRTKFLPPVQQPQFFQGAASLATPLQFPQLPANETEALRDIKRQLMDKINRLSHSIDDAVDEAPLIQRAAALTQFINSVIKISAQLPPDPQDYLLEDGEDFDAETESAPASQEAAGNHQ